jgi:hypothetical protein
MRSPTFTALVFVLLNRQVLAGSDVRTAAAIDLALARQYFDESKTLCERDGGRLWGKSLCGPLLFADPKTRAIVANQSDKEGKLRDDNGVFVGTLPADQNIANTAFTWAGVKWTMVAWPLPGDRLDRVRILLHELWHRVQDDLGLPSTGPSNSHLDGLDGRTWLRLEWAALRKALESQGDDRRQPIEHALTFRVYRRSLFPDAIEQERSLEMHEGLANYTGVALADADPAATTKLAIRTLDAGLKTPSFTRSFAYASGPAYGMLLDAMRPDWRRNLSSKADLGELLGGAIGFAPPGDLADEAKRRAASHDGDGILAEETERDRKHKERLADAEARLVCVASDGNGVSRRVG